MKEKQWISFVEGWFWTSVPRDYVDKIPSIPHGLPLIVCTCGATSHSPSGGTAWINSCYECRDMRKEVGHQVLTSMRNSSWPWVTAGRANQNCPYFMLGYSLRMRKDLNDNNDRFNSYRCGNS